MVICVIIPNVLFIALFYKTKEFKYFINLIKNIIGNMLHRNNVI